MTNRFKITFILLIVLTSCSIKKDTADLNIELIDIHLYNLKKYKAFEKLIKSKDESYNHFVSVSEDIYPYFNSHKLKRESKRFIRKDKSKFIFEANYFPPDMFTDDIIIPTEDNCFVIKCPDGQYDFYLYGEYIETLPDKEHCIIGITTYKNIQEARKHEKIISEK